MTRQRHLASIGLGVVFIAISGFALWCSQALGPFTDAVRRTSRVADDYGAVERLFAAVVGPAERLRL